MMEATTKDSNQIRMYC